jgi:hypothetical protein
LLGIGLAEEGRDGAKVRMGKVGMRSGAGRGGERVEMGGSRDGRGLRERGRRVGRQKVER